MLLAGCSLLPGGDESATPAATAGGSDELTSVGWKPVDRGAVADGGTLRLAVEALPDNFDPQHTSNDGTEVDRLLEPTVGSAIRITEDGGWEVDPDYARDVEIVDRSPLTVRVDLNRDAVWEGGTAITAQDMIAFWRAQNGSDDDYEVLSTRGYDQISAVEPGDDEYSYTVTFDEPISDWPRFVYPRLPAKVSESPKLFNSGFTDRSVSSNGPYRVTSIDRDTGRVVQEPNPRWWGDRPRLKAIVWQAATSEVQLKAIAAGDLDAVDVSSTALDQLRDTDVDPEEVVLERSLGTEWTQLTMNGASGPLQDVAVRRAVALSLDRRALAATQTRPVGAPGVPLGSFVLLPGQRGYTDQSDLIATDRAAAAQLLDDAGWTSPGDGAVRTRKGRELSLTMPVPETATANRARAGQIAEQLGQVGIEVTVQTVPDDDFFAERIVPLDFDLATFTHEGGPFPIVDAERLFYPIDSGQNFTGVEDDELAAAWDKGIAALDDTERARVVRVLDRRLFRDVPLVPIGVTPRASLVSTGLANYGPAEFIHRDWTAVGFLAPDGD